MPSEGQYLNLAPSNHRRCSTVDHRNTFRHRLPKTELRRIAVVAPP
ncbi:hypothetical protein HanIR_Chr13g0659921 [Helianthus annuus]|nr:hypothetical protein HanIR_Chr13g0659921 [Helianthus annuus]